MGPQGVRALKVVGGNGYVSKWFGCPKDSPVTERLVGFESIRALEVGIDGYKMVSLAIAVLDLPYVPRLWYPTMPSPDLCLNDKSFTGESPSAAGHQLLFWTRFGGPGGIYLRSLTEVCVTRLGDLCSIEFHYDTDDIPMETLKLGRRNFTNFSHITRFPIDGPDGEIFLIQVDQVNWPSRLVIQAPGSLLHWPEANLLCPIYIQDINDNVSRDPALQSTALPPLNHQLDSGLPFPKAPSFHDEETLLKLCPGPLRHVLVLKCVVTPSNLLERPNTNLRG
ncbi:MAG: hypothetical protein M1840_003195 [Geoglossum simile]|nr:MAG: hypothetical protein M1840_003195 [Geoglossum simile]